MLRGERFVFIGPSIGKLSTSDFACVGFTALPPAQRGDIDRLLDGPMPELIVLVDGYFEHCLAVGHLELRNALEKGCCVIGMGSIGAIRAFEMRELGMRGHGEVYQKFVEHDDFQDDEVALLHAPFPPYAPISEPLVHIRFAMEQMRTNGEVSSTDCEGIVGALKQLWFGERTAKRWLEVTEDVAGTSAADALARRLDMPQAFRLKSRDVAEFFMEEKWR